MNMKVRKTGRSLWMCLLLLTIGAAVATVLFIKSQGREENGLTVMQTEGTTVSQSVEETNASERADESELETYHQICTYIDAGDARSAADALLADQSGEEAYARLMLDDPELLERILVEAACFYNEDGSLFQLADFRLKGYFTDKMFSQYWNRVWNTVPDAIAEGVAYDGYLFRELLNWYERGGDAIEQIIDLRYAGMIDDELYSALVEVWDADPMDDADSKNHIPLYGMRLSAHEKEQIRIWLGYVDEGETRKAVQMMLSGDITDNVYRWMKKNDADLTDSVLSQAMYELVAEGAYDQLAQLILDGYVSDSCFGRYWSLLEFTPEGKERFDGEYQTADLYFVYEMERICNVAKDVSPVQMLWENNLIDEHLYDLLISRVGGWEAQGFGDTA